MNFDYKGQQAYMVWYVQNIVTSSAETIYGREVLYRAFVEHSQKQIPMHKLMPYIYEHQALLLNMTCQQIWDALHAMNSTLDEASIWVNISGRLLSDGLLFEQLWSNSLQSITLKQKVRLVLQVCEDSISASEVIGRVRFLRDHNFVIAMDDFGFGHSNLVRLLSTDFDIIK